MTDVPNSSDAPANDPSLVGRRIVAFIISFALGGLVVALGIIFFLKTDLSASFPMAFIPNVPLFLVAGVPAGFFFLIWVDYFMGTKIIPD
jgi:hypothetical protein